MIVRKREHKISIKIIDNIHYDLMKFIFFKINIKRHGSNNKILQVNRLLIDYLV